MSAVESGLHAVLCFLISDILRLHGFWQVSGFYSLLRL